MPAGSPMLRGGLLSAAAEADVADPEAFVRHLAWAMEADPARRPADLREWSLNWSTGHWRLPQP